MASINATKVAAEVYSNYVMAAIPQDILFHIEIPGEVLKKEQKEKLLLG